MRAAATLLDRAPVDIVMGNRSSFEEGATVMKLQDIFRRRSGDERLMEAVTVGGIKRDAESGYGLREHGLVSVTSEPKGIAGTDLDTHQKELLRRLVRTYHEGVPTGLEPSPDVRKLHFSWAGPISVGAPHY
jgi:hypothetical protein